PGEYLRFNSAQFADQREIRPVRVRGPPAGKLAGAREVEIADGDLKVRAFVDGENVNSVFFEGKSLPKELQSPERLLGFVTAIDVPALQKALRGARANDAVRVKVRDLSQTSERLKAAQSTVEAHLRQGRPLDTVRAAEEALKTHKDDPKLHLLKAVALAESSRPESLVKLPNDGGRHDPRTLIDELNRLAADGRSHPNLLRATRLAVARAMQKNNKTALSDARLVDDGTGVRFEAQLSAGGTVAARPGDVRP